MRRIIFSFIAIAVLGLTLGACNASVMPVAARVDNASVSVSALNDALTTASSDPGYQCFVQAQSQGGTPVFGKGSHTYASSFVATQLGFLVTATALQQELASAGVGPANSLALTAARSDLVNSFAPAQGSSCTASGTSVYNSLKPSYRNTLLTYYGDEIMLAAHLIGTTVSVAAIHAYEVAHVKTSSIDCVSAVLVNTKATAERVSSQLAKGANFAAVAHANSTDAASAQNGGAIGCFTPPELQAPLDTVIENLTPGRPSGPVSFSGKWLVLEVTSRSLPEPSRGLADLVQTEIAKIEYSKTVETLVNRAKVDLSPNYGSWKKISGGIEVTPPIGPNAQFVPNEAAIFPQAPPSASTSTSPSASG